MKNKNANSTIKYYRMSRIVPSGGAGLFGVSHFMTEKKTGRPMGDDFEPPLIVKLNKKFAKGKLPTFFESPALIARQSFAQVLTNTGVTNVEQFPVIINDETNGRTIDGYLFLNIVGRVKHLLNSEPTESVFVLDEDTDYMIISEKVYASLTTHNFDDIRFEEFLI